MEKEIKGIILKYIHEDSGNKMGTSDQITKFSKALGALSISASPLAAAPIVFVDVYEYHHDVAPKNLGAFRVSEMGVKDFTVSITGLGNVKFSLSGKAVDSNLDLFCLNPRTKK